MSTKKAELLARLRKWAHEAARVPQCAVEGPFRRILELVSEVHALATGEGV